ncbi:MAG: ABC transporter permease [Lentimicrobiaceae bacterium]|nr:ABC transporter permease [Lentimicrobiaceae bacterium]MCO5266741.1 ABC transporter permease [Lentimicrobium sp.]HPG32668.1 ABC transporter permease [Lentimicrobium sp.]
MKRFIIKEFLHIFRDVRSMVILFGMPLVQVLLFGFAITNEVKDVNVSVVDPSNDIVTTAIQHKLFASGYFLKGEKLFAQNEIEESFRKGQNKMVIVFESNFAQKLERGERPTIQLIADASDPNTANLLVSYASNIISGYNQSLLVQANGAVIIPEIRMMYNPALKSVYMFVPGVITILLMLVSAMMTSISIAREKELGTMEVLLVSPLKPLHIVAGKVMPYVLLSFINAITILLLSYFVFGVPVKGSLILLMAECILFIVLALSLGIFISTISNNQQTAMMLSMFALMLPTILLSGFIFPIENMPLPLQWFSAIMPPRWFIIIIKSIMLKGTGIAYFWKETLILLIMTTVFIVASVKKFKIRLA